MAIILGMQEAYVGGLQFWLTLGKNAIPYLKNN
jgi:hypothetical protein